MNEQKTINWYVNTEGMYGQQSIIMSGSEIVFDKKQLNSDERFLLLKAKYVNSVLGKFFLTRSHDEIKIESPDFSEIDWRKFPYMLVQLVQPDIVPYGYLSHLKNDYLIYDERGFPMGTRVYGFDAP